MSIGAEIRLLYGGSQKSLAPPSGKTSTMTPFFFFTETLVATPTIVPPSLVEIVTHVLGQQC